MPANTTIQDYQSLSTLAAKAILIEDYIDSKLKLESISNDIAKSIISELTVDPESEKQKVKDTRIKQAVINGAQVLARSVAGKAPSIENFLNGLINQIQRIDVTKPEFNRSSEQEQLNAIGDVINGFNTGLSNAIASVRNASSAGRDLKTSDVQGYFGITTGAAGAGSIQGFNSAGFAQDLLALTKTKEGQEILNSIKPPRVQVPKSQTVAGDKEEKETEKKEEKLSFEDFMQKAMQNDEFKNDFNIYMSGKGFGPLQLPEFMKMVDAGLIVGSKAKQFIEEFAKTVGKNAFEKVKSGSKK